MNKQKYNHSDVRVYNYYEQLSFVNIRIVCTRDVVVHSNSCEYAAGIVPKVLTNWFLAVIIN